MDCLNLKLNLKHSISGYRLNYYAKQTQNDDTLMVGNCKNRPQICRVRIGPLKGAVLHIRSIIIGRNIPMEQTEHEPKGIEYFGSCLLVFALL